MFTNTQKWGIDRPTPIQKNKLKALRDQDVHNLQYGRKINISTNKRGIGK